MTQDPCGRGDWQAVINANRVERHDAAEWFRYGSALRHTLKPGSEAGKQQQKAVLAFVQAQRDRARAGAVAAAQRQAVMVNLRQALQLVGIAAPAEPQPLTPLGRVLLVLGIDRSGASALAGLLCQQGFRAPHNPDGGDTDNPAGYWVLRRIRAFLNSLLEGGQSSWEDALSGHAVCTAQPCADGLLHTLISDRARQRRQLCDTADGAAAHVAADMVDRGEPRLAGHLQWHCGTGAVPAPAAQQRHPGAITRSTGSQVPSRLTYRPGGNSPVVSRWPPPRGLVASCGPMGRRGIMVGTYRECNSPRLFSIGLMKSPTW